jgi:hypothetical protein
MRLGRGLPQGSAVRLIVSLIGLWRFEMFSFHRILRVMSVLLAAGLIPACNGSLGQNGNNSTPPSFGGVTSATAGAAVGQVNLVWSAATDFSGTGIIQYNIWYAQGTTSGSETYQFSVSAATYSSGYTVTGLASGKSYIFHVEAQDGTGATDGNSAEATCLSVP